MSPAPGVCIFQFFMRYEEEILCYTKTYYDFADVKKSIFQFPCDL